MMKIKLKILSWIECGSSLVAVIMNKLQFGPWEWFLVQKSTWMHLQISYKYFPTTSYLSFHSYGYEWLDKQTSNNIKSEDIYIPQTSCPLKTKVVCLFFLILCQNNLKQKQWTTSVFFSCCCSQSFLSTRDRLWLNIFDTWQKAAPLAPVEGSHAAAVLCVEKSQVKQGQPLCTHTSASTPIHLGECGWMRWGYREGNHFVWRSLLYSTPVLLLICCSSTLGQGVEIDAIHYHCPPGATATVVRNLAHISGLFKDKINLN